MLRNTLMFSLILSLFTMLACDPEEELKKKLEGELTKGFGIESMVLANKAGGTQHKVEEGDTITITFNEAVHSDFTAGKFNVNFARDSQRYYYHESLNYYDYHEVTIRKQNNSGSSSSSIVIVKFRIHKQPFTGFDGAFTDSTGSWDENNTVLTITLANRVEQGTAQTMDNPVYSNAHALAGLKNKDGNAANPLKQVKPSGGF